MLAKMRLSVLIPTLRRPEQLGETLESVLAADPPPHEIVVIDGDSERSAEPVLDAVRAEDGPQLVYIAGEPSVTKQRNLGIDRASGDIVIFLDDDVAVGADLFAVLERAFADETVVGATGPVVEPPAHRFGGAQSGFRRILFAGVPEGSFTDFGYPRYVVDKTVERDVEFMPGCLMSVRRNVAATIRFDETMTGYALAEDEDFSYRASRAGRIRFLPEAPIEHKKTGFSSANARELGEKVVVNRAYLFRKNFNPRLWTRLQFAFLIGMLLAHRVVNREWASARGILDGIGTTWRRA